MEQRTLQQNKDNLENLLKIFKECEISQEQIESIREMGELLDLLNSHYSIEKEEKKVEKKTEQDYIFEELIRANKELTERVSVLEQSFIRTELIKKMNEIKTECDSLKETSVSFYHKFYDSVANGINAYYTKGKSSVYKTLNRLNEHFENYSKKMLKKFTKKYDKSKKKYNKTIHLSELSHSFVDILKNRTEDIELKPYEKGVFKFMENRIDKTMTKELEKQEAILNKIESTHKRMIKYRLNPMTNFQYDDETLKNIVDNVYTEYLKLNQEEDINLKDLLNALENTYREQKMTPEMLKNLSNFNIFNKYLKSINSKEVTPTPIQETPDIQNRQTTSMQNQEPIQSTDIPPITSENMSSTVYQEQEVKEVQPTDIPPITSQDVEEIDIQDLENIDMEDTQPEIEWPSW